MAALFHRKMTPAEIYAQVAPSVVAVETFNSLGRELISMGSGVVVGPGCVATNKHVVERGFLPRVKAGEDRLAARVSHAHPSADLCQLQVERLRAPAASIRDSSSLAVGEKVYAIGAPLGLESTMSEGLISGLRPENGLHVIQTTAPISKGSSGGGLFDEGGKLVGITSYFLSAGQNLNFALPADLISTLRLHPVQSEADMLRAQLTAAAVGPAAMMAARLELGFPQANFAVWSDEEQVVHVSWGSPPSVNQVREYLRSLILRRELPNVEFDFNCDG